MKLNEHFQTFFKIYSNIDHKNFPLLETEVKLKDLRAPWMSKVIRRSSKEKRNFYLKFLKSKIPQDEVI